MGLGWVEIKDSMYFCNQRHWCGCHYSLSFSLTKQKRKMQEDLGKQANCKDVRAARGSCQAQQMSGKPSHRGALDGGPLCPPDDGGPPFLSLSAWLLSRLCGSQAASPCDRSKERPLGARETGPPAIPVSQSVVTCRTERAEVCPSGLKVNLN